jgi:hypothetical protein
MRREPSSGADQRIAELGQRFSKHAVGRRPQATPRTRERQSLYLDTEVVARATQAYREISHQLYPRTLSKSAFWEALLGYGLDHLPELKQVLADMSDTSETSETGRRATP